MLLSGQNDAAERLRFCGNKAYHLARLREAGFRVPPFLCVEREELAEPEKIRSALERDGIRPPYSVRSSAEVEDGEEASYAGQFQTFLYVPLEELPRRMAECMEGTGREGHLAYSDQAGKGKMHIIIQQMVEAELSGVLFTQNPLGILSEMVTVVGAGVGANVVEDRVPTTTYYDNLPDGTSYHVTQPGAPELPADIRQELQDSREELEALFGPGVDVEYAVSGGQLYFLQARRITALAHGERVVLDNSNIVESYPGITLPLTAGFVGQQYTNIFQGVVTRLSGGDRLAKRYGDTFSHMVECCNGRMYYRIGNWYGVIGLLPFSKRIIPLWREMLGVTAEEDDYPIVPASALQKLSIALHTLYYFFRAPAKMAELEKEFLSIEAEFRALSDRTMTLGGVHDFYRRMESQVMEKWDYTLINDMYTFLHTGIFRGLMRRRGLGEAEIQAAVADVAQLASLQPVKALLCLAEEWRSNGESEAFVRERTAYLERYGNRSIGELKLETETFCERPERLMEQIEQYAKLPALEELIGRLERPEEVERVRGVAGFFLSCAKKGIEYRERSRMNRTRLFGFARSVFLRAGALLTRQGRLSDTRDVFYLNMGEVFQEDGTDYRERVEERKYAARSDSAYPPYSRLVFDSRVTPKPCLESALQRENRPKAILQGTPCSSGRASGPVLLVEDPREAGDVSGKILVTRCTDPGWAFLLAASAGLISEKGSLLSHTAIIARELHIPMIVAVTGAAEQLQNGDFVELDCETGLIRRREIAAKEACAKGKKEQA